MKQLDASEFKAIGQPLRRKEDLRLLTGKGRFTDDFSLEGQAYAVMVRCPHPHARIRAIDARRRARPAGRARRVHRRKTASPTASTRSRTSRCRKRNTT